MIKRFLIAAILVALFLGGVAYFNLVFKPAMIKEFVSKTAPPAATVTAERAGTKSWLDRVQSIGTLIAIQGVELATLSTGATRVPAERELAHALSDPYSVPRPRAAVQRRVHHQDRAAERAHQLPAAQFGGHCRRCPSRAHRGRGDRLSKREGCEFPGRLLLRLPERAGS